jgi:hypothetical protein
MALTEARFAQNGITLVFSDQIITPADMERELFSRVLISSVEYKGAGDFLVQHAERVITAQQRLAREGWGSGRSRRGSTSWVCRRPTQATRGPRMACLMPFRGCGRSTP